MTRINIKELENLCIAALRKAGVRDRDAEITVDHYLENQLSGKASHGVIRVVEAVRFIRDRGVPANDPEIAIDKGSMVVLNATGQLGTVAGKFAVDLAIERARKHGLALIGARNYIASTGSMAYYLRHIVNAGLVAIMGCNSVALVAPPGGRKRMIGTNPVGIGIPGESGDALIADLATSAIAYGKIMVMKDKGQSVPEGMLIDKDGNPSCDPADAYEGAILPLAYHKGFALGLMVELLAGPLIGAKAAKQELCDGDGLFIIAIDPSHLEQDSFAQQITETLEDIRQSPRRPGIEAITLPGQRSAQTLAQTKAAGDIDVVDKTLSDLRSLAAQEAT